MKHTEHINPDPNRGIPYTCVHCLRSFGRPEIAQATNRSNAVCLDCYDGGMRINYTVNTARVCDGCGRKVNAGECYYCIRGIKEVSGEYEAI